MDSRKRQPHIPGPGFDFGPGSLLHESRPPRRTAVPSPLAARLCILLLLALAATRPALAQEDFRAVLADNAGLMPGAEFKKIFRFPKATVVTFETGEPPAKVSAFYKKDMAGRGWTVEVDDVNDQASFLLLTKNGRRCIVEAQRGLPGRTGFSVSL